MIKQLAYAVLVCTIIVLQGRSVSADGCWDECMNTLKAGLEESGDPHCCKAGAEGFPIIVERECHPELDPGGFPCPSWVGRWLEDGGCWALGNPVAEGQNCFEARIEMAVRDLDACTLDPAACAYGNEYMSSTGSTICYECPSEGPPHD